MANPIKLSDAQVNVLVELNTNGVLPKGARGSTLDKLEGYGFIEWDTNADTWIITNDGQKEIGVPVTDREAVALIASLDDVSVQASMLHLTAEEMERLVDQFPSNEVFNSQWADWEKELGGFEATIGWKGTEVWDGLTASEIREDMDTARPINRKARRTHFRTLRNAFRRQTVLRPRKALKITGATGL